MARESADEAHLLRTIELAHLSRANGNHPFGSLLVDASGRVVLEAENTALTEDFTGHAELNVVRAACKQFDFETLEAATLYSSTEPCVMCSGAIYWSGIGRVVYALGADTMMTFVNDVSGSATLALPCREIFAQGGRSVEVSGPHLVEQAGAVHAGYWS
jgi:tRNA(Arg) A34 adenosine deaminase TadA